MEKTKVVSVRLPERLIAKLDECQHRHRYWKKNAVIVQALSAFLDSADPKTLYDILRYWHCSEKKMVLKFEEKPKE